MSHTDTSEQLKEEKSYAEDYHLTVNEMMNYMYDRQPVGNVIDHTWYKIIKWKYGKRSPGGKPHREAIELLADIYYWYRPKVERDEKGNVTIHKKFKADILQRSYIQIEESLGMTQDEAKSALKTLESFGIAKREFRTITVNGLNLSNVMFIRFFPQKLKTLVDEYLNKDSKSIYPPPFEQPTPQPSNPTPPPFEQHTNTETSPETSPEKDNVRDSAPIHGEKKKSPPPKVKLTSPQRMLLNKLISYKPEWGEPLKEADVTAWMLAKGWTVGRIEEVLELYKQRIIEYKARGEQIHSMGAMMRHALNTGEKPTDENYDKNVAYAKELSKTERCLEVTKRYVKIVAGVFEKEFYFTMPHKIFSDSLNQSLETSRAYS